MLDRHSFPITWSDRQSSIHRGTFFTNRLSLAAFRKESCQRLDFDFLQYNHSHKICVDFLDSKSNWDGRQLLGNAGQHLDCDSLYTLHFYLLLLTRYQNLPWITFEIRRIEHFNPFLRYQLDIIYFFMEKTNKFNSIIKQCKEMWRLFTIFFLPGTDLKFTLNMKFHNFNLPNKYYSFCYGK